MRTVVLAFFFGVAGVTHAIADGTAAQMTLEAFYGTCLANGPSFERTKAAATLFKWKPLSPEALTMLAPQQTPDRFEGWLVTSDGYPEKTIVGVTQGRLDGKPVLTCTMAVVGVNGKDVEAIFLKRLTPRKVGELNDGMQENRMYKLTTGLQDAEQTVSVLLASPANAEPIVVLSSMIADVKR